MGNIALAKEKLTDKPLFTLVVDIKTLLSLILFYCGSIIIIASIIENKLQTSGPATFGQRAKSISVFVLIGLVFISLGWLTWPGNI